MLLGNWTMSSIPIPNTPLEDLTTAVPVGLERYAFITFIRKMLTWDPDVRETAEELVFDVWLNDIWHRGLPFSP